MTITQLMQPYFYEPHEDPLAWIFISSGIPEFVINHRWISISLDILVPLLVIIILLLAINKNRNYKLLLLHLLLFNFYLFVVFSYPTLSIKKYLGLTLLPILFLAKDDKTYKLLFSVFRYFVLFIFSSSALWKIFRGSVIQKDQFVYILQHQHIDQFHFYPDHLVSLIAQYIIGHPTLASILFLCAIGIQLAFTIGFITRKWDRVLALLLCVFVLFDFLFMRIEYWEFLVFLPLFFSTNKKERVNNIIRDTENNLKVKN